ncbi:MAG TPA: hypothetical protein VLN49_05955 [Gemmatimonadaceae bacterium]|nr:hypothetical protein [Gemmatimonadaceae bacterium]
MRHKPESSRPFHRELPGGGFVAIEVTSRNSVWREPFYDGRIIVERRAHERREGHEPPVIAKASAPRAEAVVDQLLPAAQSNAMIGAALLRKQSV